MEQFEYVLYVEFHAQRKLCDKQNVLFHGTPVESLFALFGTKIQKTMGPIKWVQ